MVISTTGIYEETDGSPVLRFERTFPHSAARVWDAISDPERLAQWFPTTVEFAALRPGEPIRFRFTEDRFPAMGGEVREVTPPHRLVFTWGDDVLTFTLQPRGAACRLAFTIALDSPDKAARDAAGWDTMLDRLDRVLSGTAAQPGPADDRWQRYYDAYRRLGLPATAPIPE